jgi:Raf kinase inhibitor-like YbhB/YbcL family protein
VVENAKEDTMPLQVTSPAFADGGDIPRKYTCDGQNVAPPLEWSGVPKQSRSVAVICDDPDAPSGTFTHWVRYDIPASTPALGEQEPAGVAGVNSFGKMGFGGPCPPHKDRAHHYHFHVYALDLESLGRAGLSKEDALDAMQGQVVAEGELVATYQRAGQ